MKKFLPALLLLVCTAAGTIEAKSKHTDEPVAVASGSDFRHEVLLNAGTYSTFLDAQVLQSDGIVAGAGYLYSVLPWLQLGGLVFGGYDSAGETVGIRALANFNFPVTMKHVDSVFLGGAVGWNDVTRTTRAFAWRADAGVRIPLGTHVFWRPIAGVRDNGGGLFFAADLLGLSLRY